VQGIGIESHNRFWSAERPISVRGSYSILAWLFYPFSGSFFSEATRKM